MTPDVVFGVVYQQESFQKSQAKATENCFTNVHGFADADFDMDIDGNFHESEALFFGKLGYTKREDDAEEEEEEEEEKKLEGNDEANE